MSLLESSMAALRISGDTLNPDEMTQLLGHEPTSSHRKGDQERTVTGHIVVRKTGMWCLDAKTRIPGDLDSQVVEILSLVTSDLAVWHDLNSRFDLDLYCGLFMQGTNDALEISSSSVLALGERGIKIILEIYQRTQALKLTDPCPCGSGMTYGDCCAPKAV